MENIDKIKTNENFIRNNLYNAEFINHEMNINPYFNLIKLNEAIWNQICIHIFQIKYDSTLYFPKSSTTLRKRIGRSWSDIEKLAKDNDIHHYFGDNDKYVFISGGRALSMLISVPCNDTDYFLLKKFILMKLIPKILIYLTM